MSEFSLAFSERNLLATLSGKKRCTSRRAQKCTKGDHFVLEGRKFRVLSILPHKLGTVAHYHYGNEGYDSEEDFILDWAALHDGVYDPELVIYTHYYKEVMR